MKIVIVGAGLGGLTAAFRLVKSGHDVHVLERREALGAQGGPVNIRPGASRAMLAWGLGPAIDKISSLTPTVLLRSRASGDLVTRAIAVEASEYPDWAVDRNEAVRALHREACKAGASVLFGHAAVDVEDVSDKAVLTLEDGRTMEADLVLAADGIRSRMRQRVLADLDCTKDPIVSKHTFYAVSLDEAALLPLPGTSRLRDQTNFNIWMGEGGYAITRFHGKQRTMAALFGISSETDQTSLWDDKGDIDLVRSFYKGDCSELVQALAAAKSCDRWRAAEVPDLPRWTSKAGRVLLLGDAAHGMHLSAAQGFSMIVEDIAALDTLIHCQGIQLHEDVRRNIPAIGAAWQSIRIPRVERIKANSKWNTDKFSIYKHLPSKAPGATEGLAIKSLRDTEPNMDAEFGSPEFSKWTLDYDVVAEVSIDGHISCHTHFQIKFLGSLCPPNHSS